MLYAWKLFSIFVVLALLFLLAPAVLVGPLEDLALPGGSAAVLAGGGDLDYIVISPDNAFIDGGGAGTQAYSAEAFDAQGISLGDVTQYTNFTIEPEAGGSWEGCTYTSEHIGDWGVTGTHITGKTDTVGLHVLETPTYPGGEPAPPGGGASSSAPPGTTTETERPAESMPLLAGDCEPPHLEVDKTVSPETICLNNQATVTLNVTGAGNASVEHLPMDVMLIIDRSGSMEGTKLTAAKTAAKTFVGLLNSTSDRSGLVSFSYWHSTGRWGGYWEAKLNQNLTSNKSATNSSITSLTADGNTAMGEGIYKANEELNTKGRNQSSTIYAEILLSDGIWNTGRNPIGAAQEAANNTIIIYTIGLGTDADNATMKNIANITGGKYYYAPNSTTLGGIYQDIAGELSNIAGTGVVVTEVLPGDVNYINGTAVPTPNSTSGQTLTWNWSSIIIGSTRTMTFNVTFDYPGYQLVDVYPDTRINYTNYLGNPAGEAFPETNITVSAAPVANFSANATSGCAPLTVKFTDNSTGNPTNWSWNFPGGSPSNATGQGPQTVTYSAAGNYTVSLNVTNACGSNNMTKTNYIKVTAAINRYNLTISSTSGGNVTTPGEGTYTYNASQVVNLVATADANYHFVNWTGEVSTVGSVNSATTNITMNGNYTIVANFAINRYNLSTSSTSGGNVTTPGEGTYTYNYGTVVNLVATADANYHFVNWTGEVGTVGNVNSATTNITMNGNYSIVANFAIDRYNLSTSSTSGGNVTTPGEGTFTYNASQVVNLAATADANYHFVNWTGEVGTVGNVNSATTNITMNGNYTIVANFAINRYNLSTSSTSGGNVTTPGEGVFPYDAGAVVSLVATADANYHFVNWTGEVGTVGNVNSATTNITMNGNYTIVANFAINRYNLSTSSTSGGNVTTPGEGTYTYDYGTVVNLAATADANYHFVNWTGEVSTVGNVNSSTTTITMTGNYSIVANFAINRYNLSTSSTSGGNVTTPGEGTYTYNASQLVNLAATADANYHFVNWTGEVGTVGNVNSATTNITMNGNYTIVANFAINRYNLSTSSSAGGNVTTPGEGTYTYDYGTVVNLAATADANYHFVNWTGDVGTVANVNLANTTITMNGNYSIVANFAINRYNLTVNVTPSGGNVTVNGTTPTSYPNTTTWNYGDVVTLNATAASCYHFVNWTGNLTNPTNITMNSDKNVTANFALNQYNLSTSSTSGGNVTTPGEGTYAYNCGTVVVLVATADANYHFVNWTGDVGTVGNVNFAATNLTMNGNYTIVANFAINRYNLTISSTSGGNVTTPGEGTYTYNCGTVVSLVATADANYHFVNWTGDVGTVGNVTSATTNITMNGNYSITANFAINRYNLTISSTSGGNVTTPGEGTYTYDYGTVVNLTATADANYHFVNWTGDVGTVANVNLANTTITMNGNYSIVANFAINRYNLNTSSTSGGNVTTPGEGTYTYDYGTVVNLVATPDANYTFVNWTGDIGTIGNSNIANTTITMTGNYSIVANFGELPPKTYNLTISSSSGGNVTIPGEGEFGPYDHGTVVGLDATPDANYHFVNWTGNVGTIGNVNSATTNITMNGNYTIVANFAINRYNLSTSSTSGGNVTIPGEGTYTYDYGTVVDLVATADANYHFVNWTGDVGTVGNVTSATTNITMTGNYSIVANFAIDRYNLTISSTSGGNVTTPGEGTYTYDYGTVVNLTATADANCHFVNWTGEVGTVGNVNSSTTNITITMTWNCSIVANFAINRYNLSTSSISGGNVTIPGEGTYTYDYGTVVNLVATADANYHFVNWTGDVGTVANVNSSTTNVTMTGNYSIVANFAIDRYNLSTSSTSGGNVTTPGEGVFPYDAGAVVSLVATPDANYHFVNWTGEVGTVGNVNSSTTNITMNGNYSIVANFAINRYNLTISSTSGGNVTTPGEGTYTYNASQVVNLVATADANYHFVNWTGDVGTVGNVTSATTNITMNGNYSIVANFATISRYNLSISSSAGGNVTTPGEGVFPYDAGVVVSLVATADANYDFANWTGNVGTIANVSSATTNITMNGNYSIVANFTVHQPKICVSPSSLPLRVMPNTTVTTTYTITNCGGGTLHWDSSNVTYIPNGNMTWLTQNITSGTLTANASDTVLVTVNTTGLVVGTYYSASITITGSTFILPIIVEIFEAGKGMRDLPGNNLMPNETYPGDTFDVYVNFIAPADDFNAIGLTDVAPDGWEVQVNKNWTWINGTPASALKVNALGNKAEIMLDGPFSNGTNISVMYKVTVPTTAKPGINEFPLNDCSKAWLEYYVGEAGPNETCVGGEYQMMVTVPGDIVGETRDVNANLLPDVDVMLYLTDDGKLRSDISTPNYRITVNITGKYYLVANKTRYFDINTTDGLELPGCDFDIDLTTPVKLAAGNVTDFEGNLGLIPRAPTMSYALKSVNMWVMDYMYPEEWRLAEWKAMDVCTAWLYPS